MCVYCLCVVQDHAVLKHCADEGFVLLFCFVFVFVYAVSFQKFEVSPNDSVLDRRVNFDSVVDQLECTAAFPFFHCFDVNIQ